MTQHDATARAVWYLWEIEKWPANGIADYVGVPLWLVYDFVMDGSAILGKRVQRRTS